MNLTHDHFNGLEGVYIIWHGGATPATVFVGKGTIRDRLTQHRADERIKKYEELGLFATWSVAPVEARAGIEAFLIGGLKPIVQDPLPPTEPVQVNLPWP